jgi:hypothetical protein
MGTMNEIVCRRRKDNNFLATERKTRYRQGKPTYYNPDRVPPYFASKSAWKERGYRVKRGSEYMGICRFWNGRAYNEYELYHLAQVEEIKGDHAAGRRREWAKC